MNLTNLPQGWRVAAKHSLRRIMADPSLQEVALAIARHESGNGESKWSQPPFNNPFNIRAVGSQARIPTTPWRAFVSIDEAFDAFFYLILRSEYYEPARAMWRATDGNWKLWLEAVGVIYCPDTPEHPNQAAEWAAGVWAILNEE